MNCIKVFVLLNPCRCGYYPDSSKCTCTREEVSMYLRKISGPFFDRIDICAEVLPLSYKQLTGREKGEDSKSIGERVKIARDIQQNRYKTEGFCFNGNLSPERIKKYCPLNQECKELMEAVFEREGLSVRGYHKILKVARTIADLDGADEIKKKHLTESIFYRVNDKKYRS